MRCVAVKRLHFFVAVGECYLNTTSSAQQFVGVLIPFIAKGKGLARRPPACPCKRSSQICQVPVVDPVYVEGLERPAEVPPSYTLVARRVFLCGSARAGNQTATYRCK